MMKGISIHRIGNIAASGRSPTSTNALVTRILTVYNQKQKAEARSTAQPGVARQRST